MQGKWLPVRHSGEFFHHDYTNELCEKLNDMGATRCTKLFFDSDNHIFEGIAFVPNQSTTAETPLPTPIVQRPTEYPGVQYIDE
jgi:hypothetical protein